MWFNKSTKARTVEESLIKPTKLLRVYTPLYNIQWSYEDEKVFIKIDVRDVGLRSFSIVFGGTLLGIGEMNALFHTKGTNFIKVIISQL